MDITRRLKTAYRRGNLEAAGVILEDIAKYGGEESGLVKWARLVTDRHCRTGGGGEPCCMCGLMAEPCHRPDGADGIFCASCCPVCRPSRTEDEDFQLTTEGDRGCRFKCTKLS
jgi:hypothetical protein